MSLYNMINGVDPATYLILPMLGKHPNEYPRFRDCFVGDNNTIEVFTRVGGGNREGYALEIKEMREMEGYITDYDDSFDRTYATFAFNVPDRFRNDFDKILSGKLTEVSDEYREQVYNVWPKLKTELAAILTGV